MAVRTHNSAWRTIIVIAPLLGVAFIVLAALQGEPEVMRSRGVHEVLAAFAAVGAIVAFWTARRLAAIPAVSVARALPGLVALRGIAQPLPGDAPLISPNGEACLWFHHSERVMHRTEASDSVRAFLLVDDSGSVVVLPAGADITGSSRAPMSPGAPRLTEVSDITGRGDSGSANAERLLRAGDAVHAVGRFVPPSEEALELQTQAAALAAREFVQRVVIRSRGEEAFRQARAADAPPFPPAPPVSAALALPVLASPEGAEPFIVSIGSSDGQGNLYGFMAVLDTLVLLGSGATLVWLSFSAH